jgi:tetratricopeptide (TPR) repeat protein
LKSGKCLVWIILVTSILFCNQLSASAQTWMFTPEEKATIYFQLAGAKTNTIAQFGLGKAYLFEKKYNEAKICYKIAGSLGIPDGFLPAYYFNLSLIYIGLGNNKEAIEDLRKCLSIKPYYKGAKELLGMIEEAYKKDGNNTMITIERARP